jgi:hypothetical protein
VQGRRDFAFGMEHAMNALCALAGPGLVGSQRPCSVAGVAADTPAMLAEGARWFDHYLRAIPRAARETRRDLPESWKGSPSAPPDCRRSHDPHGVRGQRDLAQSGKIQRTAPRLPADGSLARPSSRSSANATGGWSRIVAVLSARTPAGKEIVVAGGGVPTREAAPAGSC